MSYPVLPNLQNSIALWQFCRLCLFALLLSVTYIWRLLWSIGAMIVKGECLPPCHFFYRESYMTAPRLNAGLHREFSDWLSHAMAQQHLDHLNEINLNIHCPEVILNEELWRRTEETEVSTQIKRRK